MGTFDVTLLLANAHAHIVKQKLGQGAQLPSNRSVKMRGTSGDHRHICTGKCYTIVRGSGKNSDYQEIQHGNPDFHGSVGNSYDTANRQSRYEQNYHRCVECMVFYPPNEWPSFPKKYGKPSCPCCGGLLNGKHGAHRSTTKYWNEEREKHRISLTDEEKIELGIIPVDHHIHPPPPPRR